MFGAGKIVTSIGASASDVANSFVNGRRDTNVNGITIAKSFGDLDSVAFVSLDFVVGFALGLGRGHDDARKAKLNEPACENKASRTGFITNFKFLEGNGKVSSECAEGAFNSQVGTAA